MDQSAEPDVWLDAVQVWEVKCADLSLSPVYKAAMGMVSLAAGLLTALASSYLPPTGAGKDATEAPHLPFPVIWRLIESEKHLMS